MRTEGSLQSRLVQAEDVPKQQMCDVTIECKNKRNYYDQSIKFLFLTIYAIEIKRICEIPIPKLTERLN